MSDFKRSPWLSDLLAKVGKKKPDDETMKAVEIIFQYAETAIALHRMLPGGKIGSVTVNRVNIKDAPRSKGKAMLVVAGQDGRSPVVTFHTGDAGIQLFHGFLARIAEGRVQWKADSPLHAVEEPPEADGLPALPEA